MSWKDFQPINTELAGNPVNWVIVTLMVFLSLGALALVFHKPMSVGDN